MSRTNLDFLFQVTAPAGDRTGFNALCIVEPRPGFGDHLSQASSTTTGAASVAGRTDDRSSAGGSPTNDYDSSATEQPRDDTATGAESAPGDQGDSAYDSTVTGALSIESTAAPVGEDDADADGLRGDEGTGAEEATNAGGTSTSDARQTDGEQDTEDDDGHGDESLILAAEIGSQGIAASQQSSKSAASDAAIGQSLSEGAGENSQTSIRATADKSPVGLSAADALLNDTIAAKAGAIKAATAPGEPVVESVSPNANRKLRPAERKTSTETEQALQRGEQLNEPIGGTEPDGDRVAATDAAKSKAEATLAEQTFNDSDQTGRETASEEGRDANSQSRQRNEAAALANKVVTAAVANGAAVQPESGAASRDASDGKQAGRSVAANVDSVADGTNRLHAAGLSKRGSRTGVADEMPRIDPARFVGRVAKAFHTAQERGGTLQIRLSPPELGAMRLELTVKDGVMTAALETETASARRVLLEHLPALRDRLAEQNIRVERFDVDVRRDGGGNQADPRAAQDQQQPQQGHGEQRRRSAAQPPSAEAARQTKPSVRTRTNNHGINLVA